MHTFFSFLKTVKDNINLGIIFTPLVYSIFLHARVATHRFHLSSTKSICRIIISLTLEMENYLITFIAFLYYGMNLYLYRLSGIDYTVTSR